VLDIFALFQRRRGPPRTRKALDRALGVNDRFDVLAFFRRRGAPKRWVNAPGKARRSNGYLNVFGNIFGLFLRPRAAPQRPAAPGERRRKDGLEAPAPVYPRRTETAPKHRPRWIEPERHEEAERIDAPHAFEAAHPRRWREPEAERFYDAERSEVSPDVEMGRRSRWDEPEGEQRDDAERIDSSRGFETRRRPLWDEPEQEGPGTDDERIATPRDDAGRRPLWDEPETARPDGYLAVQGVEKSFAGRKVVRGVSLYLRRGEAVGLLGPNGAGKTTVFYMITGLVKADRGRIEFDGHDITGLPMYQRGRLGIGYLPQEASIFRGLTVEQNIRAVLEVVEPNRRKREAELDALLDEFNIARLRKTPSIALSGGERRRVEIARSLATRPSYMLLDEPFAGIDPIAVGDIQALVRHLTQRGIGVLITDHNVRETLGLTDRAYIIYSGEVLTEGNASDIVNNPEVRRLYLGEEFRL
jgi:lipopolysaccharide export system ATP-binding protein